MDDKKRSLLLGIITIFCWGSLATFGNLTKNLPPFFVLGICFLMGSVPGLFHLNKVFPSWKITFWGAGGYFLYHFFLFTAFRFAPAVEANLINYMWPVLMVLLTPVFFRDTKLSWYHVVGSSLAIFGCGLLVAGKGAELKLQSMLGYLLAAGAAITWPIYSIGKKKLPSTQVWAVSGFCFGAGILSLITHLISGGPVDLVTRDWVLLSIMGLGPFGVAFYCWDLAVSKGDTRVLGALSYLTPVISTLGLVVFAGQELSSSTFWAMVMIIGGASAGLLDFLPKKG